MDVDRDIQNLISPTNAVKYSGEILNSNVKKPVFVSRLNPLLSNFEARDYQQMGNCISRGNGRVSPGTGRNARKHNNPSKKDVPSIIPANEAVSNQILGVAVKNPSLINASKVEGVPLQSSLPRLNTANLKALRSSASTTRRDYFSSSGFQMGHKNSNQCQSDPRLRSMANQASNIEPNSRPVNPELCLDNEIIQTECHNIATVGASEISPGLIGGKLSRMKNNQQVDENQTSAGTEKEDSTSSFAVNETFPTSGTINEFDPNLVRSLELLKTHKTESSIEDVERLEAVAQSTGNIMRMMSDGHNLEKASVINGTTVLDSNPTQNVFEDIQLIEVAAAQSTRDSLVILEDYFPIGYHEDAMKIWQRCSASFISIAQL